MSMCIRCNATLSQPLMDPSGHAHPAIRFEALHHCSSCDAEARLMILSEAAQVAATRAQEQAKLSARWILAILVFTCGISLFSLLPQSATHGTGLAFSNLSVDLRAKSAQ